MSTYRVTTSAGRAVYHVEQMNGFMWVQQSYRFPSRMEAQEWIDAQDDDA